MAVSPINIARVSQGLRTNFMVESLRRNQREVFASQTQIATGRRFVNPSDDPIAAARSVDLSQALSRQNQFRANLQFGDNALSGADAAIGEITDLLVQASSIALQNVSNLTSASERAAEAELVANIRQQVQTVGNRQVGGRFIFGGRDTLTRPFVNAVGGIAYVGDTGQRFTRVERGLTAAVNLPGNELFSALSRQIATGVDLTPRLTPDVRLEDISTSAGEPIEPGVLVINEVGGAGAVRVDLTGADTIGGVVERINAAAQRDGAAFTAELSDTGLVIKPGSSPVSVGAAGSGSIAQRLGIRQAQPVTTTIEGQPLTPRITRLTPIADLAKGEGIDLESGLVIRNGAQQVTIDLTDAKTVQDIVNALNNAGVFVLARISDDGTGIDVFNRVSGTALSIGENGGTTAADLGIRTFDVATPLSELNFGRGVHFVEGKADLRIDDGSGNTVDVNLDGAATIGDVITLINDAATEAGVNVKASFTDTGNGLRITGGGGAAPIVSSINISTAVKELGLDVVPAADATDLVGRDVNPVRTEGILDALVELEQALRADDTQGISLAGGRLDGLRNEVTRMHGIIGARAQAITSKRQQMEDAVLTTQTFLSQVRDLDYAEAITRLQGSLTQLQANLQTSSTVQNLSLLDFLR